MEKEIQVLKESQRGAYLVTDGEHVAWIMRRSRRSDGTITKTAQEALANGMTYEQWQNQEKEWKEAKERAKQEREEAYQKGKELVTITLPSDRISSGSEKSWKVRTDYTQRMYGRTVSVYEYFPKSVVSVLKMGEYTYVTMPLWLKQKHNGWLQSIMVDKVEEKVNA
ncbi:MAG: hypothetical protein K6G25_06400 [Bacteroidales bacterium]|nr:hypothetical protein [Bacteroidales bacterium]